MTVTKLPSSGRAFGESDVGAEYFNKNYLTPFLKVSIVNSASAFSLPGARKKAALEYKGREMLVPNLSTVALCNDRVLANAMSTFY